MSLVKFYLVFFLIYHLSVVFVRCGTTAGTPTTPGTPTTCTNPHEAYSKCCDKCLEVCAVDPNCKDKCVEGCVCQSGYKRIGGACVTDDKCVPMTSTSATTPSLESSTPSTPSISPTVPSTTTSSTTCSTGVTDITGSTPTTSTTKPTTSTTTPITSTTTPTTTTTPKCPKLKVWARRNECLDNCLTPKNGCPKGEKAKKWGCHCRPGWKWDPNRKDEKCVLPRECSSRWE